MKLIHHDLYENWKCPRCNATSEIENLTKLANIKKELYMNKTLPCCYCTLFDFVTLGVNKMAFGDFKRFNRMKISDHKIRVMLQM
jgi:hypothetical protein